MSLVAENCFRLRMDSEKKNPLGPFLLLRFEQVCRKTLNPEWSSFECCADVSAHNGEIFFEVSTCPATTMKWSWFIAQLKNAKRRAFFCCWPESNFLTKINHLPPIQRSCPFQSPFLSFSGNFFFRFWTPMVQCQTPASVSRLWTSSSRFSNHILEYGARPPKLSLKLNWFLDPRPTYVKPFENHLSTKYHQQHAGSHWSPSQRAKSPTPARLRFRWVSRSGCRFQKASSRWPLWRQRSSQQKTRAGRRVKAQRQILLRGCARSPIFIF